MKGLGTDRLQMGESWAGLASRAVAWNSDSTKFPFDSHIRQSKSFDPSELSSS